MINFIIRFINSLHTALCCTKAGKRGLSMLVKNNDTTHDRLYKEAWMAKLLHVPIAE